MKKTIFYIWLLLLMACNSNSDKQSKSDIQSPIEVYKSYTSQGVFNNEQFLKDNCGTWVCYKYEEDGEYYPNSERDARFAKEFAAFFYFEIENDTISFSKFRMPIQAEKVELKNLNDAAIKTFQNLSLIDSCSYKLNFIYKIRGQNNMYYSTFWDKMFEKENVLPYCDNCLLGISMWCFVDYIAINSYGYYWYYKKGEPINKGIEGMPSDISNRFIVNRTYENCSIKEAAYKLIEEFPKGTEGLLIADDDPGESAEQELSFPTTSFELYSTVYKWEGQDKLTIRVGKNSNCTFVFEFNKQGNNVSVKYWNDVVFPFEKGYCSYN